MLLHTKSNPTLINSKMINKFYYIVHTINVSLLFLNNYYFYVLKNINIIKMKSANMKPKIKCNTFKKLCTLIIVMKMLKLVA
jgi:hypothetical protein